MASVLNFAGNILGGLGGMLQSGDNIASAVSWCPFTDEIGGMPHGIHLERYSTKGAAAMLNTILDLCYTNSEKLVQIQNYIEGMEFEFTMQNFQNEIEKMVLEKSRFFSPKDGRVGLQTILDDVKSQQTQTIYAVQDLLKSTKKLPIVTVEKLRSEISHGIEISIRDAMNLQNRELVAIIEKVRDQLQAVLKELIIDPDNPKPTELRTEENSKQILKLSEQVVPLVSKCEKLLAQLEPVITKMSKALQ